MQAVVEALGRRRAHVFAVGVFAEELAAVVDRAVAVEECAGPELVEHDEHVALTFADGAAMRAPLVIGADGLHSGVRNLLFGDEAALTDFLGAYLAVHLGGAGNPSTTRTLVAWLFEVPWLIAIAFFAVRAWRQHVAYRTAMAEYNAPRPVAGPGGSTAYHHGACVINHKTAESAAKCRKG